MVSDSKNLVWEVETKRILDLFNEDKHIEAGNVAQDLRASVRAGRCTTQDGMGVEEDDELYVEFFK